MAMVRFPLLVACSLTALTFGLNVFAEEPLPESAEATIGYNSVDEALTALRKKPGVKFTTINGWLVATDEQALTVWSFAPKDDPAYPAAVQRQVVPQGSGSAIEMSVHCEASKQDCDNLVRTFARINGIPIR